MATITKRNKSYRIKVSCGYDCNGKQVIQSMTWTPKEGMSEKQIQKELNRQAVLFEEACMKGLVTSAVEESYQKAEMGAWKARLGYAFSGEATYRCEVDLPEAPLPEDQYVLHLGKVEYTAEVHVNGKLVGVAPHTPYAIALTGEQLTQHAVIEIVVANTSANQMVTFDARGTWMDRQIGGYYDKCKAFARDVMGGGLYGPVVLRKK